MLNLFFALSAWAKPQSNTVPSNQLALSFGVQQSFDNSADAEVFGDLYQATKNGLAALEISDNETITVSTARGAIQYNAKERSQNHLPFLPSQVYTLKFVRYNGQVFESTVIMPEPIRITAPKSGSSYLKTQPVNITWSVAPADDALLALTYQGCDNKAEPIGDIKVGVEKTSAEIPANYFSPCGPNIRAWFLVLYANGGSAMKGLQYSGFDAVTTAQVDFSYGSRGPLARRLSPILDLPRKLIESHQTAKQIWAEPIRR